MEYIIGGISLFFGIFLTGYFMKKKYYKESDRLEKWKLEINSRPVIEEMQKVKQLNMNGQTEVRFEKWRHDWDEIITAKLPDLEELLFDAEEYIDRYRFKKAKAVQMEIEKVLTETDEKITTILSELNELVGSEEKNRTETEELKEIYRESKKILLAHRHSFGKSEKFLEERLNEVTGKFTQFNEKTAEGNYLDAREVVLTIKGILEKIKSDMDLIPDLLVECHSTIPFQLSELKEGYQEMLTQGYILDHIQMEEKTEKIAGELETCLIQVETADLEGVSERINEWKETIDELYDLLENEVISRQKIGHTDKEILAMLRRAKEDNHNLKREMKQIQQSYQLEEVDIKSTEKIEKRVEEMFRRFELLEHKVNGNTAAYSFLNDELLEVKEAIENIAAEQNTLSEKLNALRKDELSAREKVAELNKQMTESIRTISNSNIPGVPLVYRHLIEDAQESINNVMTKLEGKPLNVPMVQQYLEVALLTTEKVTAMTAEVIETAALVEKVIQYGNRYRSRYPSVNKGLIEAEISFRSFNYKEALEQAAASIEEIEPGALEKIEVLL
ncbi:septation ring formation regulator EzrA [Bacillus benzoevorans]|uniref:Septation ring formation regulator EzrA n=1 Tax=Bacillus benzoevorans TaxID=1456 RepID=A0A7X0LVK5_9BACI|nr:septation ring formation regulator EzrA [Bacillus benzoevorans]MBB6445723.1 septation ring formation regulator [Bacillus benzoevorans]